MARARAPREPVEAASRSAESMDSEGSLETGEGRATRDAEAAAVRLGWWGERFGGREGEVADLGDLGDSTGDGWGSSGGPATSARGARPGLGRALSLMAAWGLRGELRW